MGQLQDFCRHSLDHIRQEGRYRHFRSLNRFYGDFPRARIEGVPHPVIIWCSNDYMGMGQKPEVIHAMIHALHDVGAGAGGTRNISGTTPYHQMLEAELASFHQQEAALLFNSGYMANETVLSTLGRMWPGCTFFSDEKNHASIIRGIQNSRAPKHIFRHNDMDHLRTLLECADPRIPKVIVWESLYSMDGDVAPSQEICEIAEAFDAVTYVDEVHAIGLYGPYGAGMIESLGLQNRIHILQGTLGKAVGLIGGYIAASHEIVDFFRSTSSGFIFTTALPPVIAAGACESLKQIRHAQNERLMVQQRAQEVKDRLMQAGIPYQVTPSHIIPVYVSGAERCTLMSQFLIERGLYLQPINYPTVPVGQERFRVTPTPLHTSEMIQDLVQALKEGYERFPDDSFMRLSQTA